jgi:hypothetical protein
MVRVGDKQISEGSSEEQDPAEGAKLIQKWQKDLRGAGLACIQAVFNLFKKLDFSREDIDEVFDTFIEPMLGNLENMSTGGESTLLKVLKVWGSVPRCVKIPIYLYFPARVEVNPISDTACSHLLTCYSTNFQVSSSLNENRVQ